VLEALGHLYHAQKGGRLGALMRHLEAFLLELGTDCTFVGRQKRFRLDDEWYRVDLVFYHRGLRCLVIIDLKLGRLTHADVG
jgi:predicted nuclease of restriction endonuclease-like (RecB) superfamily